MMLTMVVFLWAGPCSDEVRSHQFDFWIGTWDVYNGEKKVGTNTIAPILEGCVLQENWLSASGQGGTSLNYYSPQTGKWHQFWVYQSGLALPLMSGGLVDGAMVLEGIGKDQKGKKLHHKITWTPNEDGSVRQYWQTSGDDGKSWAVAFDGLYKKRTR